MPSKHRMAVKLTTWIAGVVFLVVFVGAAVFMAFSGINEQQGPDSIHNMLPHVLA